MRFYKVGGREYGSTANVRHAYVVSWAGRQEIVFGHGSYDAICEARRLYGPFGVVSSSDLGPFS